MLYKSIRMVTLSACALLITRTFGADYYVTASSMNTTDQNLCIDANADDTCTFLCDKERWSNDFNCHNAGTCKLYCGNEKECFKESVIDATNSNNDGLYVYATGVGNDCLKKSNIYLPTNGHAIFNASDTAGNNRFKEMTLHSGTNTQNIYIDCSGGDEKDECKQLIVNADSAQYLEINIGSGELNGDENKNNPVIINCPVDSTYSGVPCIIDASDDGKLEFIQINSVFGVDQDLLIKIGDLSIIDSLDVSCSSGSTFVKNQTIQFDTACGAILPTLSPTIFTSNPTVSPSSNPTTASPTNNPTTSPTNNPTIIPTTANPTTLPTTSPTTISPTTDPSTISPTTNPTISPSMVSTTQYPTLSPTNLTILSTNPSVVPTNMPTSSTTESESDSKAEHHVSDEMSTSNVMQDVSNGKSNGKSNMKVFTENNYLVLILCATLLIAIILLIISVMIIRFYKRKHTVAEASVTEQFGHINLSSVSVINTSPTRGGLELADTKCKSYSSEKFGEEQNANHNLDWITTNTKGGPDMVDDGFANETTNNEGDHKTDDEELYSPVESPTIGASNDITKGYDEDKSDDEIYKKPVDNDNDILNELEHGDEQYKD